MTVTSSFENIGWTVGNHCNATCGHCYSWKVRKDSREFLTKSDVDRVVSQLKSLGVKTVNLGGNEPIYTHGPNIRETILPYIVRTLHENGIPVGLTTNGVSFTYMDEHFPEELKLINDIDFSLDSPFEKEHNANRGNKLYKLTVEAITRSLSLGIDCSVITCGMKANFDESYLSAFLQLTKLLGSEFRVNTLKPVEKTLLDDMPTAQQFYEGFAYLMRNTKCITLGESCVGAIADAGTSGCPCGTTSFRINAKTKDGKIPINPCVYMHEFKAGDLLTEDIHDIVASPQFRSFAARRHDIPKVCRDSNCSYLERCRGGCTARAYLVTGTLDSKDPYCPQEYVDSLGHEPPIPKRPSIGCDHGFRVHDNYLCTWIGEANRDFTHEKFHTLEQYYEPREVHAMSSCEQTDGEGTSLVRRKALPLFPGNGAVPVEAAEESHVIVVPQKSSTMLVGDGEVEERALDSSGE